jgi:hypothetical protein
LTGRGGHLEVETITIPELVNSLRHGIAVDRSPEEPVPRHR